MRKASIDEIDEPVLQLGTARLDGQTFRMDGYVNLQGGRLLYEKPRRHSSSVRPSAGWAAFTLAMQIDYAVEYEIDDVAGVGVLIVESIEVEPDRIVLHGTVPCTVLVRTSTPSHAEFCLPGLSASVS